MLNSKKQILGINSDPTNLTGELSVSFRSFLPGITVQAASILSEDRLSSALDLLLCVAEQIIGVVGFKGQSANGSVEIGYGTFEALQYDGIATSFF